MIIFVLKDPGNKIWILLFDTVSFLGDVSNLNRFIENDFEFHIALAHASRNKLILEMMKHIVEKVHKEYDKFKNEALFQHDKAVSTAKKIGSLVANGEGDKAANLMKQHLNLVTTELKRKLPDAKWIKKNLKN